jgi:hypothetical protein
MDLSAVFGEQGRDILARCVAALRQAVRVEEVWLFGSCARGNATPESDLDLLVVLRDDHGLARPNLECHRAIRCLYSGIPTDVLAISSTQWRGEQANPFGPFEDVCREGVRLYGDTVKLFQRLSGREYAGPLLPPPTLAGGKTEPTG